MKLKKYQLVSILEQCKLRGLTTIDEILNELKVFKDMDVIVESSKDKEIKRYKKSGVIDSPNIRRILNK